MRFAADPALLVASSEAGRLVHICEISKVHLKNQLEDTLPVGNWLFVFSYNCNGF